MDQEEEVLLLQLQAEDQLCLNEGLDYNYLWRKTRFCSLTKSKRTAVGMVQKEVYEDRHGTSSLAALLGGKSTKKTSLDLRKPE